MKKTRIPCAIAAMVFIATSFAIPLFADDTGDAATIDMLTSGDWLFKGKKWSNVATFKRDNTLVEHNLKGHNPNVPITWKITGNKIILDFGNYQHMLLLPLDPKGTVGVTSAGDEFSATRIIPDSQTPGSAQAVGSPTVITLTSLSPELQQKAADLVKTYRHSLVMITGNEGSGSGFIATIGGAGFLVTNAHVMAGIKNSVFKDLDDTVIPTGKASIAVGADLLRLEAKAGTPFEVMQDVDQNASIGDDVVVLGTARGESVVNTLMAKIVGIGPNLIEINRQIAPGDSGSPIIHLKSGKVIAVVTYLPSERFDPAAKEKLKGNGTRRFGCRLDSVKTWQPVNWQAFYAQADAIGNLHALTTDLLAFYNDLSENGVATAGLQTNPVIKDHIEEWIKGKGHGMNPEDARRTDEMFVSFLKSASQTDLNAAQASITYDYFQRKLAEVQQIRSGMAEAFEKLILHKQ